MRLATFNLESLGVTPETRADIESRAAVMRPALERIGADVLCLQEVNGQHVRGAADRQLFALDLLFKGTRYEKYERVSTSGPHGGVADVHNLVTVSRYPIRSHRAVRQQLVRAPLHTYITAEPKSDAAAPIGFDRPLLLTEIELPDRTALAVINVHLRAPLASPIAGQKIGPFVECTPEDGQVR